MRRSSRRALGSTAALVVLLGPACAAPVGDAGSSTAEAGAPAAAPAQASPSGQALPKHMILVPAGEFLMGTNRDEEERMSASFGFKEPPYENEEPQRSVFVDGFWIDRFEATNVEFERFRAATGTPVPEKLRSLDLSGYPLHPVVYVTWYEADAYCNWRGDRLPTETEWEKAARGSDGRRYPWGDDYDESRANTRNPGSAPAGSFPEDVSPYGVRDMAGNVAEWVDSWYLPYPGNESPDPAYGERHRVVRGGSWGGVGHYQLPYLSRSAIRGHLDPRVRLIDIGFRCARSAEPGEEGASSGQP